MPGKCWGSKSPDMRVSCFCFLLLTWLLQFTVTASGGLSIQSRLLLKTSCAGGEELLNGQYIWQDFWVLCFEPCFYFPPNDQTFSGVSLLTASLYSQNVLLWPFYFLLRYNSWYQWKCTMWIVLLRYSNISLNMNAMMLRGESDENTA